MLERSRIWDCLPRAFTALPVALALVAAGCAITEGPLPDSQAKKPEPPVAAVAESKPAPAAPKASPEEARALLAQAETDIQRARAAGAVGQGLGGPRRFSRGARAR